MGSPCNWRQQQVTLAAVLLLLLLLLPLVLSSGSRKLLSNSQSSALPESHNGIGSDIRVFMFGNNNQHGHDMLKQMQQHCSSQTTLLHTTTGRHWTWHDKINRLLRQDFRQLPNKQLVLVLDGDVSCFPCTRNLTEEFLRFRTGVLLAGYPFNQETSRYKSGWFPDVQLLDRYDLPADSNAQHNLGLFKYLNVGTIMGYAGALKFFLAHQYLGNGYVDVRDFDDQSDFWTNMYLRQEYSPWRHLYNDAAGTSSEPEARARDSLVRIAVDAEGSVFQLSLQSYKGQWMRVESGLQRQLPYRKEACIIHFVGNKHRIMPVINKFRNATVGSVVYGNCPASISDASIDWSNEASCVCKAPDPQH